MITVTESLLKSNFRKFPACGVAPFLKLGLVWRFSWDVIHNLRATSLKLKTQGLFLREYPENKINRSF